MSTTLTPTAPMLGAPLVGVAVRLAAVAALDTHDAFLASEARDNFETCRNGLPIDRARWVQWYELDYKPCYDAWSAAMDRLAEVMGRSGLAFPGRHPWSFRPVCEAIITGAHTGAHTGVHTGADTAAAVAAAGGGSR